MRASSLRVLQEFVADPRPCSYLSDATATLAYRLMIGVNEAELEGLLSRGWRRFGLAYFRPACEECAECVPLRVIVAEHAQTRSQRRVWQRGAQLELRMGTPIVDAARMDLYQRWHAGRSDARGWESDGMTAERYFQEFAFPHPAARELSWYDGARLVAVSLVDETPVALSAVYTYHDPDYARLSLGTLSILTQIELARRAGKRFVYLGFRVLGCDSSRYKARFVPHEIFGPEGWARVDVTPEEALR